MKTLTELIQNYQNGIPDSDSEILKRMEPLVKVNITVRQSRQSGVARATCPD